MLGTCTFICTRSPNHSDTLSIINYPYLRRYLFQRDLDFGSLSLSLSLSMMKLQHSQTGILISLVSLSQVQVDDRWKIYVLYHHAANVYDEEEIWSVVEKTPQFMYYFETLRQGRLSNRQQIPIVMNKTVRCCYKEALESRVLVTKQSHSRYLNSLKERREMKRAANKTPKTLTPQIMPCFRLSS